MSDPAGIGVPEHPGNLVVTQLNALDVGILLIIPREKIIRAHRITLYSFLNGFVDAR